MGFLLSGSVKTGFCPPEGKNSKPGFGKSWGFSDLYLGNSSAHSADFLRRCVAEAPFPIEAVRVDWGSEFYDQFIQACKELGIGIIRNPKRSPRKNGKVERLHRTIEEECLWRVFAQPDDLSYARYWINRYLAWYNHHRRHGGYGMEKRTPKQQLEHWIKIHYQEVYVNKIVILYNP